MSDFEDVRINTDALDAVQRDQLAGPVLAVAQGLAEAASAMSGVKYVAVASGSRVLPRAAVVPAGAHAKRSENKHHWLNRVMP